MAGDLRTPGTVTPGSLRVGLVQLEVEDDSVARNVERALGLISDAPPADLYVLPELWTSGYAIESWRRIAEEETPGIVRRLSALAGSRGAWIAGSMISAGEDGALVNRLWCTGPAGERVGYDKGHLFAPMAEPDHLSPGVRRVGLTLQGWAVAPSICYDLRFPELYRLDALDGAELFLVVSEWPLARSAAFDVLCRARAMENEAYLVACNRVGIGGDGTVFGGGSLCVAPDGEILARLTDREEVVRVTLDRMRLDEARRDPILARRRAGLDWD